MTELPSKSLKFWSQMRERDDLEIQSKIFDTQSKNHITRPTTLFHLFTWIKTMWTIWMIKLDSYDRSGITWYDLEELKKVCRLPSRSGWRSRKRNCSGFVDRYCWGYVSLQRRVSGWNRVWLQKCINSRIVMQISQSISKYSHHDDSFFARVVSLWNSKHFLSTISCFNQYQWDLSSGNDFRSRIWLADCGMRSRRWELSWGKERKDFEPQNWNYNCNYNCNCNCRN
jgi:hypothetical protein